MSSFLRRLFPVSEDARMHVSLERALMLQRRGYDIAFNFLPRYPDMPHIYVCDGRSGAERLLGVGFDCSSRADAFAKSLSETLERTLWREDMLYWNEHAQHTTEHELGARALSLSALAGFSQAQQAQNPRMRFSADTRLLFSRAMRLSSGSACYVPAQLVSGTNAAHPPSEPLLRMPNSNGLATHETFDEAARRGLLELIERDAFMITFSNTLTPPRLNQETISDSSMRARLQLLRDAHFAVDILLLPTDMPVTVIACVLHDHSGVGPALVLGARADEDWLSALDGALTEALGVYYLARAMGRYAEPLPSRPLDALGRIAYWGKHEHTEQLTWLWGGPEVPPRARGRRMSARRLARDTEARGAQVAVIAMTPPKLHDLGLVSVCVVSPELQPLNLDEAPLYLGGERLKRVPEALGYTTRDVPPSYPHPFP